MSEDHLHLILFSGREFWTCNFFKLAIL